MTQAARKTTAAPAGHGSHTGPRRRRAAHGPAPDLGAGDQLDWIDDMTLARVWTAPGAIFGSAAGLLLIGLALAVRWQDRQVVAEPAVPAVVPPVLLIAVSFVTSSLWVPRYVLVLLERR